MLRLLPLLLILLSSCSKLQNLANINVDLPYEERIIAPEFDSTLKIPAGGICVSLPPQPVPTNSKEAMALYNTGQENILHVKLVRFEQLVPAGTGNFDFADSLRIYISATDLPELLIANKSGIGKNLETLALDCNDQNLKPYFLQDTVYMRVEGRFNAIPKAKEFRLQYKFNLLANPIAK